MYFMIYRPQKKQQKKDTEMRNALDIGDEVTTIGGNEYGTVRIHRFDLTGMSGFVGFGRL